MVGGEAVTQAQSWLQRLVPGRMKISLGLPVDRVSSGAELVSGEAIGELAATANQAKNGDRVLFNVNRHINYTNICVNRCAFCAFSRESEEEDVIDDPRKKKSTNMRSNNNLNFKKKP